MLVVVCKKGNWPVEIELAVFDPSIVKCAAARTKELLCRVA